MTTWLRYRPVLPEEHWPTTRVGWAMLRVRAGLALLAMLLLVAAVVVGVVGALTYAVVT